jgi:hypothetical protein
MQKANYLQQPCHPPAALNSIAYEWKTLCAKTTQLALVVENVPFVNAEPNDTLSEKLRPSTKEITARCGNSYCSPTRTRR